MAIFGLTCERASHKSIGSQRGTVKRGTRKSDRQALPKQRERDRWHAMRLWTRYDHTKSCDAGACLSLWGLTYAAYKGYVSTWSCVTSGSATVRTRTNECVYPSQGGRLFHSFVLSFLCALVRGERRHEGGNTRLGDR